MTKSVIQTPIGLIEVLENQQGVSQIHFLDSANSDARVEINNSLAANQLLEYFNHQRKDFDCVKALNGTEFQQRVWEEVSKIPFGKTTTYEALAQKLGDVKSTRAVAKANATNPLPLIIPCHRVIGKNGKLTGYLGGLQRKAWLLKHEGSLTQTVLF